MTSAEPEPLRIVWHADKYSQSIARIRLRVFQPTVFLHGRGVVISRYDPKAPARPDHNIIFSKSVNPAALKLAMATKAAGGRVIYDICDNLFETKKSRKTAQDAHIARAIMEIADHVVFSTALLAEQIQKQVPAIAGHTSVIPDMLDDLSQWDDECSWRDRLELILHQRFLNKHPGALHCVWFGKSHGKKAGLPHLSKIQKDLEFFAKNREVTLTIISDRRRVYWREARGWNVPHHFLRWSSATFPTALARHNVALIPLEKNGYTLGKTINRPATAILAGLGVIANTIDSYEELRPFIYFDDWCRGLEEYAKTPACKRPDFYKAKSHLDGRFGANVVGPLWEELLRTVFR